MPDSPPRYPDQNPRSIGQANGATLSGVAVEGRQGTILVIEDDPGVRHLARRTLEAAGYHVLVAEDGEEGLKLVEEHPQIDLVVTDIEMPKLDGISVARELAAKHPRIAVICMSGRLPETTFQQRIGLPLPPFLAKPFTVDDLTRTTSESLARYQELSA